MNNVKMIFKDANYAGNFQELGPVRHNWLIIGNDELSSLQVPPGWKATLTTLETLKDREPTDHLWADTNIDTCQSQPQGTPKTNYRAFLLCGQLAVREAGAPLRSLTSSTPMSAAPM